MDGLKIDPEISFFSIIFTSFNPAKAALHYPTVLGWGAQRVTQKRYGASGSPYQQVLWKITIFS